VKRKSLTSTWEHFSFSTEKIFSSMASSTPSEVAEAAEAAQPHGALVPDGARSHVAEVAPGAEAARSVAAGLA
jgi:hypothetical protein